MRCMIGKEAVLLRDAALSTLNQEMNQLHR